MALNLDLQNRNNAPYSSVDTSTMDKQSLYQYLYNQVRA